MSVFWFEFPHVSVRRFDAIITNFFQYFLQIGNGLPFLLHQIFDIVELMFLKQGKNNFLNFVFVISHLFAFCLLCFLVEKLTLVDGNRFDGGVVATYLSIFCNILFGSPALVRASFLMSEYSALLIGQHSALWTTLPSMDNLSPSPGVEVQENTPNV